MAKLRPDIVEALNRQYTTGGSLPHLGLGDALQDALSGPNQEDIDQILLLLQTGAFLNGGVSFGANLVLGSNDAFSLSFETNNVSRFRINLDNSVELLGATGAHLKWATDGGGDIGAAGANRPANIYVQQDGNFGGNVTVGGNLTVLGTLTALNTTNTEIKDQNIVLNKGGNDASSVGAGLTIERTGTFGSLIFDVTAASRWKAGDIGAESMILTVATVEPVANLIYLRRDGTNSPTATIDWDGQDLVGVDSLEVDGSLKIATLSGVLKAAAGVVSGSATTSDLPEGSNLYFTDERVDDRVAALIQNGTGLAWTYNDGLGTLTGTVSLSPFSTSDLAEGSNLYFTDERAQDAAALALTDTASITWSYNDGLNQITANLVQSAVDHGSISGLADDDHLQYFKVAGRNNESLTLTGAAHVLWATDGGGEIGAASANRPNNAHIKNSVLIDGVGAGGLGIGGAVDSTNLVNIRRDIDGLTRGIFRNTHTGASAIARWTVASGAGDLNLFGTSIAGGAIAGITADATFTGGFLISILGANALALRTNSTDRLKVNADGTVNVYGPHTAAFVVKADISNADGLRQSINSGTSVAQIINGFNAALQLGTNGLVRLSIAADGDVTINEDLIVTGDLTVNGTTTTINAANLEVEDKNITVNNGGNDVSAEGAGLTVERVSTNGSLIFDSALTSKWKAGLLGSEAEILTTANIAANAFVDGGNSFGQTANLGTNDAFGLDFKTDGVSRMTISATGVLTAGLSYMGWSATATPTIKMRIGVGGNDGDFSGIKLESTQVVTANGTRYFIGFDAGAPDIRISTGVTNSGYFIGTRSYGLRDKAADLGALSQLSGIDIASGHYSSAGATVSTTDVYGINIKPYQMVGTITNFYGVRITVPDTGGTVTNNWAFYQDSSAMKNYFAGQTLIGNPVTAYTGSGAPAARLHVRSDNSTGAILALGDGVQANINALAYGTSNSFSGYRAQGTAAAPTAVASQSLTNLQGYGYDGSAFALGGYVTVQAGTTWTGSDHETYILFGGTPSGSTTNQTILQIRGDGQLRGRDGLATAPTYSWINSPNTGLYSQGSGSFAASVSGVTAQEWGTGGIDIRGSAALPFIVKAAVTDSTGLKMYVQSGLAIIVNESVGDVLQLGTNNLNRFQIDAAGTVRLMHASAGHLLWDTDGGGNIGAPGANRPDNIYVKTGLFIGAFSLAATELAYVDDAEGLTTVALNDNQVAAADVATWPHASYSAFHVVYSISRGAGIRETGVLMISTDGVTATLSRNGAPVGTNGIDFTVDVSGANVRLRYTSTSTGTGATLKYKVLKWLA